MFLKSGLNVVKTDKIPDTPVQAQFVGDVPLSSFVLLGSCFPAPPHGKGGTRVTVLSLGAGTGHTVLPGGQQPLTQMPWSWQITRVPVGTVCPAQFQSIAAM